MRIEINEEKCIGAGQCVFSAPEVFDQREDDAIAYVIDGDPPPGLRPAVLQAAQLCPSGALTVTEHAAD